MPRFTYEDVREMPDDGKRYELLEGEIVATPAPKTRHQRIIFQLALLLGEAERAGFGKGFTAPTDVVFDPEDTVAEPDLLFIVKDRLGIIEDDFVRGAPDLVVEVLSDGTKRRDLGAKLRAYARFGVPHYWVANPNVNQIQVFRLAEGGTYQEQPALRAGDLLTCALFPGITVAVAEVFGG